MTTPATYPADLLQARDGSQITIRFFAHASLAIEYCGHTVYTDPVLSSADYAALPKADVILVSHSHYDHLDLEAIAAVATPDTVILCDHTSAEQLTGRKVQALRPGNTADPCDWLHVEAVAAYNTSTDRQQFHPREREDCGYIITLGGTRIYIAGDGENTPEMKAQRDIDIAFLPVNQPYTMTVDQAIDAVQAIRPAIFYPYHYGQVDERTDIERLTRELQGITDIRIRPLE